MRPAEYKERGREKPRAPAINLSLGRGEGVTRAEILAVARAWLGTPYLHQASAKGKGADCLGLIRGVWRELYGAEPELPPPYTPDWNERAHAAGGEPLLDAARAICEAFRRRSVRRATSSSSASCAAGRQSTAAFSPRIIASFTPMPGAASSKAGSRAGGSSASPASFSFREQNNGSASPHNCIVRRRCNRQGIGAAIARTVAGTAASYVAGVADRLIFGPRKRKVTGPRLDSFQVQASTEGAAILRVYGRERVAGELIWAANFRERVAETTENSRKGGRLGTKTTTTEYLYSIFFAVGLCEGAIDRVARVWADGKPFDLSPHNVRVHRGTEDQLPDALKAITALGTALQQDTVTRTYTTNGLLATLTDAETNKTTYEYSMTVTSPLR